MLDINIYVIVPRLFLNREKVIMPHQVRVLGVVALIISGQVLAQVVPSTQLFQQSEQHQAEIKRQLTPSTRVENFSSQLDALPSVDSDEHCFPIEQLQWDTLGSSSSTRTDESELLTALSSEHIKAQFIGEHRYNLTQTQTDKPPCLGASLIQRIVTDAQNKFIDKGYITTRILVPDQDLRTGVLTLNLVMGEIGQLKVNQKNSAVTHANRATLFNAFPTHSNKPLQLRDLEQGLENLRRLPTVSAQIAIQPSNPAGHSDILIDWQQRTIPMRVYANIDNSGSEATGKYLGSLSFAWDNPLRLNDIFDMSYTHSLKAGKKNTDPQGHVDKSSTYNYAVNYSIPFGYWQFSLGMSDYYYDQIIVGINQNYHYRGKSIQGNANLSRVLYRDSKHKLTAEIGLWRKTTRNYIDDSELELQRRRVGGWTAGLSDRSYFSFGTLTSSLNYKRGTRAFRSIAAPEELFNEGTGKMKIWTLDISWNMPFSLSEQSFQWDSHFHGQWNKTPLTAQDMIAIGERYSVRGFSGEKTLSAERGWYWRNTLAWQYRDLHQVYLGLDTGHIAGASAKYLLGRNLTGGVIGLKGEFSVKGHWNYDIFLGKPVHQPIGFKADRTVLGFNVGYQL